MRNIHYERIRYEKVYCSSCLNAKYDIDKEATGYIKAPTKDGLKISIKVLGTVVADDNRWLLDMHQPENCIYRLRVHSKVLEDSQLCVYSRAAFLMRDYVWIDCSVMRANASKDESA